MTVKLYLDVDGVINASQPQGWGKLQHGEAGSDYHSYHIRWAPAMIESLSALPVELVWCTTWQEWAARSIAPLIGWGEEAPFLAPIAGPVTFPSIVWKTESILTDQLAAPGPFIWIDDEINNYPFSRSVTADLGGLLISPNPLTGISPKNITDIEQYLSVVEELEAS